MSRAWKYRVRVTATVGLSWLAGVALCVAIAEYAYYYPYGERPPIGHTLGLVAGAILLLVLAAKAWQTESKRSAINALSIGMLAGCGVTFAAISLLVVSAMMFL